MDLRKIEDDLSRIETVSRQIESAHPLSTALAEVIRTAVTSIRAEVTPPPADTAQRTRDQISPKEWAEYEWLDVTAFGDHQRQYVRGLKR